ncbi:SH3 domain-containing kinase-binding protein 1-like isoform X2 [Homalodisca vitripennis]|uniref:SH3 domain-containing kinase-binding protein 1-like isoform X2 n=1 Tax=Homalodisca vitripennis TaxID=197043 RepID=UPI001EE9F674|nr:SH3 domain-containing kinase-binding protein 1-like isoform X2 [Homalodisca vitripennis]
MAERIEAVVEFEYKAQESDELTIKKGDFINDIRKQPGGWWEGTHAKTGKRGMFPENFVKMLDPANPKMDVTLRPVSGRRCRVLFSYQPANDDELELQVGDVIDILSEVEEGWWKGKLNAQVGVFPSNFVAEVFEDATETKEASHRKTSRSSLDSDSTKQSNATTHNMSHDETTPADSEVPELPPKPMKELCRVMYPYDAVNDDELTLREGDVITLLSRDGQDKGWWRGELHGKVGVFPDNFVQVITTDESTKPARPPAKTNVVTTNRVKDSITRPSPSASQTTAQRKSIELPPKPDEKTSPPSLSKKPVLPPPPLKKPQRSASGPAINKTLTVTQPEIKGNVTTPTKPPESPTNTGTAKIPLTPLTFSLRQSSVDSVRTMADSTDGGTTSRMSSSLILEADRDMDLDCVGRTAMLTHPTASRVRAPRRRPPSGVPLKEAAEQSAGLVNGNAEPHFSLLDDKANKAPWVEELKMNQAKKISAQGRTRVTIGSTGSGGGGETVPPSSLSPEPPKVSPSSGVTLRPTGSSAGSRPQSMFGGRSFSLSPSPSSPDTITISHRQWTELNEKVQRLEARLESQHETFVKAIKELTSKLADETERRQHMQTEMEKLANFVTQV